MSATCPELNELLDLESRPKGDVGRRHVEQCPRCRNRLLLYSSFIDPEDIPPGADVEDADRRLAEVLDRARASGTRPATEDSAPPRSREGASRPRWWSLAARPAWALAAVLALGSLVLLRPWELGPPGAGMLRDAGGSRASEALRLEPAVVLPGGGVRLSWDRHPDAESYRVQILGPDLAELLRREVSGTSLELEPGELTATAVPGAVLGWKVAALRQGASVATSATGTIRIR